MAINSNIEWTTMTASPWFGCSKVSPGCVHCYAELLTLRNKWAGWGDDAPRVRSKGFWRDAYKWNKMAEKLAEPPRIFTSLMDWLDPKVPIEWLADFLEVVRACTSMNWLLLTKRPQLFQERMALLCAYLDNTETSHSLLKQWVRDWCRGKAPKHVWYGVTVEDQKRADERLPILFETPAHIRWLSVEPMLERINLGLSGIVPKAISHMYRPTSEFIDWVVIGAESGPVRRDCGANAIVSLAKECVENGVAVFVKQDCGFKPGQRGRLPDDIWGLKQYPYADQRRPV